MMENHEQQACGGCVEVQQGLEAAAARMAGLEEEFRGRYAELEESASAAVCCQDAARLERDLGEHGVRLETLSGVIGKMRAQLDMLEPRLDAVSRAAAHNSSSTSSPIRLERPLEGSACELITSPTTLSEAHGQIATLEERLEVLELAAQEQEQSLEALQQEVKGCSKCVDSPSPAYADIQSKLDSLEEELNVLRRADVASKSHLEHNLEAQKGDLAAMHRAIAELTNDVLKAQGGADAAYAEATRQQDCTAAIQIAMDALRREWHAELARSTAETQDSIAAMADQSSLTKQGDGDDVLQQCRAWIDEAINNMDLSRSNEIANHVKALQDKMRARWETHLQEELGEVARVQAQSEERHRCELEQLRAEVQAVAQQFMEAPGAKARAASKRHDTQRVEVADVADLADEIQMQCENGMQEKLEGLARRCELEQMRAEVREEVERVWEAIGGQTAGVTERCEALTLETQRQCRTWVDGALRKLEELALRTKERLSAFASERREFAAQHEEAVQAAAGKAAEVRAAAEAAEAAAAEVRDTLEQRLGAEIRRLLAAEQHLMAERLLAPEDLEPHTGSTMASSSSPQREASCRRQTLSGKTSSPRPQAAWLSGSGEPGSVERSPLTASPASSGKASPKLRQPVFVQPASALLHTSPESHSRSAGTASARQITAEAVQSESAAQGSPAPQPRVRRAPLAAG